MLPDCVVGVSITFVPCGNEPEQVPPEQVNPEGLLVTVPLPSPVKETFNERDTTVGLEAKFALTEAEEVVRAITHEPVPVHAPPQPENVLPLLGAAVSVTLAPCANVPEHVPLEQDTPPVTVPLPPPVKVTLKELDGGGLATKFALMTVAEEAVRATTHEPVPVHAPPQPENVLPLLGAAVSVTLDPCENVPEHVPLVQDRPVGLLVTVPSPLIARDSKLSGPVITLDTSRLGELSFPDVS